MREKSIIKSRIMQYLDSKGISKYEFYKKTGVSNGVLSQNSGMSEENLMRFLSYYSDINPVWLLTGKREMIVDETPVQMKVNEDNLTPIDQNPDSNYVIELQRTTIKSLEFNVKSLKKENRKQKKQIERLKKKLESHNIE